MSTEKLTLEDQYRAAIVRKLRAEADRIEAGGAPFCYAIRCDENDSTTVEAFHNVAEARELLTVEVHGDFWPEFVEAQEWGVCVTIEDVRRVEHRADLRGRSSEFFNVALVDPDTYTGPDVMPQDCPGCRSEVRVPPNDGCPVCASGEVGDV